MLKHVMWAIGGALSFWLPVIVLFAAERTRVNALIANLVATLGFLACWAVRRWIYPKGRQSIWMLIGLYFFGPVLLSTATTFANGGFTQIHGWTDVWWLLFASVFPPVHFLLAATSGLWPSLLFVTGVLTWMSVAERFRLNG